MNERYITSQYRLGEVIICCPHYHTVAIILKSLQKHILPESLIHFNLCVTILTITYWGSKFLDWWFCRSQRYISFLRINLRPTFERSISLETASAQSIGSTPHMSNCGAHTEGHAHSVRISIVCHRWEHNTWNWRYSEKISQPDSYCMPAVWSVLYTSSAPYPPLRYLGHCFAVPNSPMHSDGSLGLYRNCQW